MCQHQPPCPPAGAPDRQAARVVASHPEQGWSLLCNGVVAFDDTGILLPDGRSHPPAPAGPPEGDRPSAPAAAARDHLCRSGGALKPPGVLGTLVPLSPPPQGIIGHQPSVALPIERRGFSADPPRRRTTCPPPARTGQPAVPGRH